MNYNYSDQIIKWKPHRSYNDCPTDTIVAQNKYVTVRECRCPPLHSHALYRWIYWTLIKSRPR